jgi:hypothetical protein
MKIALTGHTSGLGQSIYNHFSKKYEVIGMSRSNGFDITSNQKKIIEVASECDIFFNNAYNGKSQCELLLKLYKKVSIITSGSIGADFAQLENPYHINKKALEVVHKNISNKQIYPMLLLKMGYLENYRDRRSIKYSEIIDAIEFWLKNPRVTLIEFDNIK